MTTARDVSSISRRDLERLLGRNVEPRWQLALTADGRLFRRADVAAGGWTEYPDYPEPLKAA